MYIRSLNSIIKKFLFNPLTAMVIANASIKNSIATSVSHVISKYEKLSKNVHHIINVTVTEAKLFTIRCSINQACQISNVNKIIIITDASYTAKHIFDLLAHLFQIQSIAAAQNLSAFFNISPSNIVQF